MNFRTISVQNPSGDLLNAALVCSFSVKTINREFVVYSLNEKLDNNLIQIYVSSIINEKNSWRLVGATPSEFKVAANTLKSIIRDASSVPSLQTDDDYHLLDLTGTQIEPDYSHSHHSLKINDELLLKLLQFRPELSAPISFAAACEPPSPKRPLQVTLQCDDYYTLSNSFHPDEQPQRPSSMELLGRITAHAPLAAVNAPPTDERPLAQEAALAQEPQHGVAKRIEDHLQALMANMQDHQGTLQGKHDQLNSIHLDQDRREKVLVERAASLDLREAELNHGLASLASAEAKLAEVIKLISGVGGSVDGAR